jgi:hypothetical protein
LEIADSVAAVRQEGDRLVHLHSLRFEHLEQTAFGLDLPNAKHFEASPSWDILLPTITSNHLLARDCWSFADITAVDSNDQGCGRIRKLIPVSLAATNEHVLLFPQFVF